MKYNPLPYRYSLFSGEKKTTVPCSLDSTNNGNNLLYGIFTQLVGGNHRHCL